ncbi:MAG: metallophosphoesterase [Caldilineaceae bacterium]
MPIFSPLPALTLHDNNGHNFVVYGDCCSGIPGGPHEANFAAVNAVIARLDPPPEFICFLGDEIKGLLADDDALRQQWRYWLDYEMAWLDRTATPLYQCPANHTAYDPASEQVFRQVLSHLPQNGPPDQRGLSYFVRRGDLLLIFVNTMWSGLGGEGRVETAWLAQALADHADARHKLVLGHHPVHPINGFAGAYQRTIEAENGRAFWQILVEHNVLAYLCSHIMAFDVQMHEGVLQILTGGAGTRPLTPDTEYLHCVQCALDADGLRYQVLDTSGQVREWLRWPLQLPPESVWRELTPGVQDAPIVLPKTAAAGDAHLVIWRFEGIAADSDEGTQQTLLSMWDDGPPLAPFWIGLMGAEQRVALLLSPEPGRSPRYWLGPTLAPRQPFAIQIAIHTGMGPGGLLWRWRDDAPWSTLRNANAWGAERLIWQPKWGVGCDQRGPQGRPFRGASLRVRWGQSRVA